MKHAVTAHYLSRRRNKEFQKHKRRKDIASNIRDPKIGYCPPILSPYFSEPLSEDSAAAFAAAMSRALTRLAETAATHLTAVSLEDLLPQTAPDTTETAAQ